MPDTRKKATARPRGRGHGGGRGRSVVGAVVVACAALSVLAALDHLSSAGKIRRGVYEGDVALGGKTPKDAFEPRPHYIRTGMDATVWWGAPGKTDDLDMKFRNTTEGYLLPREYVADDGYVYAEIWGRPDGTGVEMYSEPAYVGADGSE